MDKKHQFNETTEDYIGSVIQDEWNTGSQNLQAEINDFDAAIDMLEGVRSSKNYEWMSDIDLGEFVSIILTDSSIMANQYFQSRDFVDVYVEDGTEDGKAKCRAAKKLINASLNNRKINHYQKYMRARLINSLMGMVWLKCWWEKETRPEIIGYQTITKELDVDVYGNQIIDRFIQQPANVSFQQPVMGQVPVIDQFNYDIVSPKDVAYSNNYCYSAQDKEWIIIRSEMTFEELKKNERRNGYINLDLLSGKTQKPGDKISPPVQTESEKARMQEEQKKRADKSPTKPYTILERFGWYWAKVTRRDANGHPQLAEPGIDEHGEPIKDAELIEMIVTYAVSDSNKVLIRFQPQFCRTKNGLTYRPLIRGLCYIHPTKDTGLSDGKYLRDINVAINDTFNIAQDRTMLATLPVFKGNKYSLEDSSHVVIEPEGIIKLENPREDLIELQIKDNPVGAINQIGMLQNQSQKISSIFPTTMGQLPGQASTTATAIAGSETRTSARGNYKSLTIEYTMLCEFYWILLQLTWQFMDEKTAVSMLGGDVYSYDPETQYTYIPLSQNIEMEHNKYRKLQMIDQLVGRVANSMNPKTPALLNKLLVKAFELLGEEYSDFKDALLDENAPVMPQGNAPTNMGMPTSNQSGVPMSTMEMGTREGTSQGMIGRG
uniref:Portal protein n=1 Tax=viral metagenome TaxID=1070528 RepID=A0A6M3KZC0_9ZZZZ